MHESGIVPRPGDEHWLSWLDTSTFGIYTVDPNEHTLSRSATKSNTLGIDPRLVRII